MYSWVADDNQWYNDNEYPAITIYSTTETKSFRWWVLLTSQREGHTNRYTPAFICCCSISLPPMAAELFTKEALPWIVRLLYS